PAGRALRHLDVPRLDERVRGPGPARRRAARVPVPGRGARARRPWLVVRRGRVPRAVARAGLDRAVRAAAVPAARLLRPAELVPADPEDDLRYGLARGAGNRPERPGGRRALHVRRAP